MPCRSWRRDGTNPSWRVRNAIRRGDPCGRPHRCGPVSSLGGGTGQARPLRSGCPARPQCNPWGDPCGRPHRCGRRCHPSAAGRDKPVLYDPASRCVRNAIRRGDPCGRPHRRGHPCHPSAAGRDKPVPYDPASRRVRNAIRRGDPCGRPHRCGRPCHPSAAGRDKPVPYDPASRRARNAIGRGDPCGRPPVVAARSSTSGPSPHRDPRTPCRRRLVPRRHFVPLQPAQTTWPVP